MYAKTIRTDLLPVHQRLRYLRASMSALSFDCLIEPAGDKAVNTVMTAHIAEQFRLVKVAFTAHRTLSATRAPGRRPADTFLISLQQRGDVTVAQDGRSARIGPQQMFVIDTTRPFTIDASDMHCLSLYLPGRLLRSVLPDLDEYTATAISGTTGSGALFRTVLESLYRNIREMDDVAAAHVAASLPELLGAALRSIRRDARRLHPASDAARVAAVRAYALEHLADRNLDCAAIARAANCSVRGVHQLFASEPVTLMRWLWNERLSRCHADLAAAGLRNRSIRAVASRWGFADLSHFSRSFKAAYGISPRAFRISLQQQD